MRPTPADPEAWNAYLAEGNATQARKRVSADVGGVLYVGQTTALRPRDGELSTTAFVSPLEAARLLGDRLARRLRAALVAKPAPALLRDGC